MIDRLAALVVRYSTAIRAGERVGVLANADAAPLVTALGREIVSAGGHPVVLMTPAVVLQVPHRAGAGSHHPAEQLDVAIQVLSANARAGSMLAARLEERPVRWVVVQMPCHSAAEQAGLALADYATLLERAMLLDQPEPARAWAALSRRQARMIALLEQACELRITTARGTDLRLGVAGRTWINGDGHTNLPDGEVHTAPIEDATEGTVYFDYPTVHAGRMVEGVRLDFRSGRVVGAKANRGEEFLLELLHHDPGAGVLGEVALGCNDAVTHYTRNAICDEKMGGTFHLALGAAHPATGGRNRSGLHWDLVGDLHNGGRVFADGRLISVDGRFLDSDWPQPDDGTADAT